MTKCLLYFLFLLYLIACAWRNVHGAGASDGTTNAIVLDIRTAIERGLELAEKDWQTAEALLRWGLQEEQTLVSHLSQHIHSCWGNTTAPTPSALFR